MILHHTYPLKPQEISSCRAEEDYKNRCSIRILSPMRIRITPPQNSALDLYRVPNTWPALTPDCLRKEK